VSSSHRLAIEPDIFTKLCKADNNSDGMIDRAEFILWVAKQNTVHKESHSAETAAALFDALDKRRRGSLDVRLMIQAMQQGVVRPESTAQQLNRTSTASRIELISPAGKQSLEHLTQQIAGRDSSVPPRGRYTPFKRRDHDRNTATVVVPDGDTPHFASESERFGAASRSASRSEVRSSSPTKELSGQSENERSKMYSQARYKKISDYKDRINEYSKKLDLEVENNDKARINGKTHQKFKYFKAIARMERVPDRMAARNLKFLEDAKELTTKVHKRGPLSDPNCSPSPIAWVYDGVPMHMYQSNKHVRDSNGLVSKDVWKWDA